MHVELVFFLRTTKCGYVGGNKQADKMKKTGVGKGGGRECFRKWEGGEEGEEEEERKGNFRVRPTEEGRLPSTLSSNPSSLPSPLLSLEHPLAPFCHHDCWRKRRRPLLRLGEEESAQGGPKK